MASQVFSSLCLFVCTIIFSLLFQNQQSVRADKTLIDSTCKKTTYPDICMSTLNSEPRSSDANLTGLARISMEIIAAKVDEGSKQLWNVAQHAPDYPTWSDFEACYYVYNSSLFDIKKTGLPSFDHQKYGNAYESVHKVTDAATECNRLDKKPISELNTLVLKFSTDTEMILHQLF